MGSDGNGSPRMKAKTFPELLSGTRHDDGLKTTRYEQVQAARPPIPITIPAPRTPPSDIHPALRNTASSLVSESSQSKRDSGLAPTTSTVARNGSLGNGDDASLRGNAVGAGSSALARSALLQPIETSAMQAGGSLDNNVDQFEWNSGSPRDEHTIAYRYDAPIGSMDDFSPITTPIPTEEQLEMDFMDHVTFSNRGSVLLGGKKAVNGHARLNIGRRQPSISMPAAMKTGMLSDELERESWKVRSMYDSGNDLSYDAATDMLLPRDLPMENIPRDLLYPGQGYKRPNTAEPVSETFHLRDIPDGTVVRPASAVNGRSRYELAGGLEDWEDVGGGDVDRYGFIMMKRASTERPGTPEPRAPQRVSTVLQLASETPRKRGGLGRSLSAAKSNKSGVKREPSRKVSSKSLRTHNSAGSQHSPSKFRSARNRLPGNHDRRLMEEAGDMLTLPPGLADIAEDEDDGRAAELIKKKEVERTEKWRKMAKMVKSGPSGEGMTFEFDTRSPKLIERTWKGIPDRWRASAWHSFLATSAKNVKGSATDAQIVADFNRLLAQSSADDVQIDMDVPRTINSHIMFRRRYRGGQRLLFRVLHSLSLYFPATGYVQGMASLAATLLCYYDEERCFVMLVRMWILRGLDKLYAPGFEGLMSALDEFKKGWMDGHDVSMKLDELGIEPTAYGTRWYLTLFNYSIPFAAQLRVWDVFMLLGDASRNQKVNPSRPFAAGLDVLHAASAALIDGTREILLDSDFENTMKVLTSWIPIKDEELFMRVAKAEWKLHHGKTK